MDKDNVDKSIDEYYEKIKKQAISSGEIGLASKQLISIYNAAMRYSDAAFLELGVASGNSTRILLSACSKTNSKLVSVDILDCSKVLNDKNWNFILSNSTDKDYILKNAPILKNGIDLIYIDSLHTAEHVKKELYTYFPLMNRYSKIFLDDIDSFPYMRGNRKDNKTIEIANNEIYRLIREVFYMNMNQLELNMIHGSTGLAELTKLSAKGVQLNDIVNYPKPRKHFSLKEILFW